MLKHSLLFSALIIVCSARAQFIEKVVDPVDYVNPLMGTQSTVELSNGNTYPSIALPWGMNFWTPQTGKDGNGWQYTYTENKIRGFKQTHQPSPWMNDFGEFSLMPVNAVKKLLELCHSHNVLVSTGGFIEHVLTQGPEAVTRYIEECKRLGFDIVEISAGFITIPTDDWLRLVEKVQKAGLKAKPEVGIQFGAGGATAAAELKAEGTRDPEWAISQAKRFISAGAYMIMIESEGITENVKSWRTDVVAKIIEALGLEKPMFEAADPEVFSWYIKNYGAEVNLFVDHSQIVQLECLRSGIWGTKSLWGRILTYKG